MDKDTELLTDIARDLFDIWREAKRSETDNWDDVPWESLSEKHQNEYLLSANRIITRFVINLCVWRLRNEYI